MMNPNRTHSRNMRDRTCKCKKCSCIAEASAGRTNCRDCRKGLHFTGTTWAKLAEKKG